MNNYGHIVLAFTIDNFDGKIIKFFTRSKWSHSFITIPDILGRPMCLEAADSGVSALAFDYGYKNDPVENYNKWNVKLPKEVKDYAISECLNDLQTKYGYLELPWFGWRAFLLWAFNKDIKSENNWCQKGTICSELCVKYLTLCGLGYLFKDFGNGSVSPQDIENIMLAHPELFELEEIKE